MLKRYLFACLPLIFSLNSQAHSHITASDFDILFLHPISFVHGITNSETIIHLTTKWEFIIIDPSYLNKKDYTRFGSGFGLRVPVFGYEGETRLLTCLYLQVKPALHYLKYEDSSSGSMIEVLGYTGISSDLIGFIDAGIGYKWNRAKNNHGLAIEVNVGLSALLLVIIPFLVADLVTE